MGIRCLCIITLPCHFQAKHHQVLPSWKSCHCLQVVLFRKLRPARHASALWKSSISLVYSQTDNPPSPNQADCFVSLLLCALLPCSFPPCAIRHKPLQKLQTGREIKTHQPQPKCKNIPATEKCSLEWTIPKCLAKSFRWNTNKHSSHRTEIWGPLENIRVYTEEATIATSRRGEGTNQEQPWG